jgi:hypothetical protein
MLHGDKSMKMWRIINVICQAHVCLTYLDVCHKNIRARAKILATFITYEMFLFLIFHQKRSCSSSVLTCSQQTHAGIYTEMPAALMALVALLSLFSVLN